ncbi:MAG: hypothetical protein KC486_06945 [Myxococcales bacterium]|nr:hypothetical protein [Myxococcales bacterium]
MSSPNLDPQVDTTLLPEPFEVNTEVVDKATAAARAALEWMSTRFGSPARRSAPAATPKSQRVEPAERDAPLPST